MYPNKLASPRLRRGAPRAFPQGGRGFSSAALMVVAGVGGAACSEEDEAVAVQSLAGTVERGRYLVQNVAACPDCHTPRDEQGAFILERDLSGVECFARLPSGGCLNSRNLTSHETGLLNRSDAEIRRMLRDGVRPAVTGDEALSPVMPYYVLHNMLDSDVDAMIAYLRTVPPVEHAVPRSSAEFEVPAPAQPLDLALVPLPPPGLRERERALNGRYLAAGVGICLECHTRHLPGSAGVLDYEGLFQGGEEYPQLGLPVTPISSNLTSDPQTGLGEWSEEEIAKAIKHGVDRDGNGICPPMPSGPSGAFGGLHDDDVRDIALYLKSLPPAFHEVPDACTWPPAP